MWTRSWPFCGHPFSLVGVESVWSRGSTKHDRRLSTSDPPCNSFIVLLGSSLDMLWPRSQSAYFRCEPLSYRFCNNHDRVRKAHFRSSSSKPQVARMGLWQTVASGLLFILQWLTLLSLTVGLGLVLGDDSRPKPEGYSVIGVPLSVQPVTCVPACLVPHMLYNPIREGQLHEGAQHALCQKEPSPCLCLPPHNTKSQEQTPLGSENAG